MTMIVTNRVHSHLADKHPSQAHLMCKQKLHCVRQYTGHLKSSQRTRALSKKSKHKCGERTCPYLSTSMKWPSPDMAKSDVIMFEEWVNVSFDFNCNFMFSTSKSSQKGALEAS